MVRQKNKYYRHLRGDNNLGRSRLSNDFLAITWGRLCSVWQLSRKACVNVRAVAGQTQIFRVARRWPHQRRSSSSITFDAPVGTSPTMVVATSSPTPIEAGPGESHE